MHLVNLELIMVVYLEVLNCRRYLQIKMYDCNFEFTKSNMHVGTTAAKIYSNKRVV